MTYQPFLSPLSFFPATVHAANETWKEAHSVDERYKAKCCGNDAKYWLERVQILRDALAIDGPHRITSISMSSVPSVVLSFRAFRVFRGFSWKNAFLEGCQRSELVDAIAEGGTAP
jgi:hypothetical protein